MKKVAWKDKRRPTVNRDENSHKKLDGFQSRGVKTLRGLLLAAFLRHGEVKGKPFPTIINKRNKAAYGK